MRACLPIQCRACACPGKRHRVWSASKRHSSLSPQAQLTSPKLRDFSLSTHTLRQKRGLHPTCTCTQAKVLDPKADLRWQDCLIVVEGASDKRAVQRAVAAQVFVLHGASKSGSARTVQLLKAEASKCKKVIALLDPDVAGRQSRTMVNACLGGCCHHAFIPVWQATAESDIRHKLAGNVGVEHASPAHIRSALRRARLSRPSEKVFSREDLESWGLIVDMRAQSKNSHWGQAAKRRAAFSAALGIGNADGKQMLRQLNLYGFTHQDVTAALKIVNAACNTDAEQSSDA